MNDFTHAFELAVHLVTSLDDELVEIVLLSMRVSLTAVFFASLAGLLAGSFLAVRRFPTSQFWVGLITAFMGLPPVVVGLIVYLLLSRSGVLGPLNLLFTPTAMIIAQTIIVFPIVAALTYQTVRDLHAEYSEQLYSLGCGNLKMTLTLLYEGRFSLLTAVLAGFGRATAEVGAVLIVGGNISHATRVMTTSIALEVSKGNLALAVALGMILITLSLTVVLLAQWARNYSERQIRYV